MKKYWLKAATAAALTLAAAASWATPVGGTGKVYDPIQTGGQYTAYVTYHGTQSPRVTQDMSSNGAVLSQFVNALNKGYNAVPAAMISKINAVAAQQGVTVNSVLQSGSISASLVGGSGGNVQATLSGLSYNLFFTAQKSYSILNVNCTVTVSIANVKVTSTYNAFTGAVTGRNATYTPSQVTNCDNSLSWIPFVGDFINNKAQNIIGSAIQSGLNGYNGQVFPVSPQTAIFGFANAIQPGAYMVNGVDAGMYIKNNLTNLLAGKSVSVFIAYPNSYYPLPYYKTPGPASISMPAFSINLADGASSVQFDVIATGDFTWELSDS
jgi:hypothetical protein